MSHFPPPPNSDETQLVVLDQMEQHRKTALNLALAMEQQTGMLTMTPYVSRLQEEAKELMVRIDGLSGVIARAANQVDERRRKRRKGEAA